MTKKTIKIAVYVYPGWHHCPERDKHFKKGWREWDLVLDAKPLFDVHIQPKIPLFMYDDSLSETASLQKEFCRTYGIDFMIYGFFWSRGKRVFEKALDEGFLREEKYKDFPFSIMWANRMPRGVLPVKIRPKEVIDPSRLVYTDSEDFLRLIKFVTENYFIRQNYIKIDKKPIFFIFDSTFFLRQIPRENLEELREKTRALVNSYDLDDVYIIALNPAPDFYDKYKLFFDAVSHYVYLPLWKGDFLQDYSSLTILRANEWKLFQYTTELPYYPSVSPGWDASPRGISNIKKIPMRYPWWPIVIGNSPQLFREFLIKAMEFTISNNPDFPLVSIASLNEWSEGHYLEPDNIHGYKWLEAVREAKELLSQMPND